MGHSVKVTRGSDTANRLSYALKKTAPKEARSSALNEIGSAMLRHAGNLSATAEYLGIGRATLNRWVEEYAILRKHLEVARRDGPK